MLNLIVVAHPDDEILGYGGTGYLEQKNGIVIQPLILCSEVSERNLRPTDQDLFNDMNNANKLLGFNKPVLGRFPNLKLNTVPHIELVKFIEKNIIEFAPENIFTHHPNDLNNDHQQISHACMAASRLSQRNMNIPYIKGLYFMEILSSTEWSYDQGHLGFNPHIYKNITESINIKLQALSEYRNVIRNNPHPRSKEVIKSLSNYRGAQIGYKYAEAFQVCFQRGFNG